MQKIGLVIGAAALAVAAGGTVRAECAVGSWQDCKGKPHVTGTQMETPIGVRWWPNALWGATDEAGSTNWYRQADVVRRAVAEADKGKVYRLGRPYEAEMPLFGVRKFVLRIPATPTGGPLGPNGVIWHDEFLATEVGQVGTQFDGLGHIGVASDPSDKTKMYFYNGFTAAQIGDAYGLKKLGAEKLYPITARGVIVDVAAAKGVPMLEAGYEITMADVKAALAKQNMADFKFESGDAVFFHTGWGKLWKVDNAKFNSGCPGIGMEVARWLSDEVEAGAWGGDTWPTEVVPNPDPTCVFCVHQHMLTRHGIVNQENMDLSGPIADGVYRFMYV